ncbi:fatty acid desaturase-domain-containing protein [Gorgonomyces haynaldii]|nr:fatty acid desaturase-domain-containing protein [Gorgonomyces haynaldii]
MKRRNAPKNEKKLGGLYASPSTVETWEPPKFTLKQVRDAVPAHCFQRSTLRSMSHVVVDLSMVLALGYFALWIPNWSLPFQVVGWLSYWYLQGAVGTGLWILAHECGHGGFSDHLWLNNTVGFILHSALLVPFFSWKYTHSKHHKGCGHMDRDQVYVPSRRSQFLKDHNLPEDHVLEDGALYHEAPIVSFLNILMITTIGWPGYLLFNSSGQVYSEWTSHFLPKSAIFEPEQANAVVLSNIGLATTIAILTYCGQVFGSLNVIFFYVVPYLIVNFWLVIITYLQHTDPTLPHYSAGEWDFLKGALATVDRDFGILNHFFHHITDTHVAHHLFSTMPFYHAEEATRAIKKVLGPHYRFDPNPWYKAVWVSRKKCQFVEDEGEVLWFKY